MSSGKWVLFVQKIRKCDFLLELATGVWRLIVRASEDDVAGFFVAVAAINVIINKGNGVLCVAQRLVTDLSPRKPRFNPRPVLVKFIVYRVLVSFVSTIPSVFLLLHSLLLLGVGFQQQPFSIFFPILDQSFRFW
jgi:hypothetical protein